MRLQPAIERNTLAEFHTAGNAVLRAGAHRFQHFGHAHKEGQGVADLGRADDVLLRRLPELGITDFAPPDGAFYAYCDVSHLTRDSLTWCADVLARTHYTRSFPCIVRHGNVWGCQFHPEKSSALGQRILKNFVSIVEGAGR